MLSQEQKQHLRDLLVEMKKGAEESLQQHDARFGSEREAVGELSSYDNHPADMGTELYSRELDLALHQHLKDELEEIDQAIVDLDNGTYGKCKITGKDIPYERLLALPTTQVCVEHAQQHPYHDRPVEEDTGVYIPAAGKYDLDSLVGYDAEDTWQDVAQYGTSDSQSDMSTHEDLDWDEMYLESTENRGYVEDFENFAATDMYGENVQTYVNETMRSYEKMLDEENLMSTIGDLPSHEKEPYVESVEWHPNSDKEEK